MVSWIHDVFPPWQEGYLGGAALQLVVPESFKQIPIAELLDSRDTLYGIHVILSV